MCVLDFSGEVWAEDMNWRAPGTESWTSLPGRVGRNKVEVGEQPGEYEGLDAK